MREDTLVLLAFEEPGCGLAPRVSNVNLGFIAMQPAADREVEGRA